MPTTLLCPSCGSQLQVPDDMLGTNVQCPACGLAFRLPAGQAGVPAAPPGAPAGGNEPLAVRPDRGHPSWAAEGEARRPGEFGRFDGWDADDSSRRAASRLQAPAVCLLVMGILALLVEARILLTLLSVTPEMLAREMPPEKDPQVLEVQKALIGFLLSPTWITFTAFCLAFNAVTIVGAVMMLLHKMRWLALLGSMLAIINLQCCVLGLPIGIWSLVVLLNPEVAAAFQRAER